MTGKITQRVHDGIGTLFTAPTTTRAKAIDHMERASAATHLMSSLDTWRIASSAAKAE